MARVYNSATHSWREVPDTPSSNSGNYTYLNDLNKEKRYVSATHSWDIKEPASSTPTKSYSSGGSGGGSSPSTSSSYNDLLALFEQRNNEAMNSAIAAIDARLNALNQQYGNAITNSDKEYQKLINQSEVNRYRSKGAIREALANRGQLDSGLGRQEQLYSDVKYGNAVSNLLAERQKARNDYEALKLQAQAEAEADKASVRSQFANALLQYKASIS